MANPKIIAGSLLALGLGAIFLSGSSQPTLPRRPVNPTTPTNTNSVPGTVLWTWNGQISLTTNIPQRQWFGTSAPNDYGGHGTEINYYTLYETEVKQGQPHLLHGLGSYAWMHNNPGNIMGPQPDYGQYPGKFGWHNFMVFPTAQIGYDAIAKYLATPRYASLNLTQAFNVYAPSKDGTNNPDKYAADVAAAAGISTMTKMQDLTPAQMKLVQDKITSIEGTVPGTIMTYDTFKSLVPNLIA